MWIEGGGNLDAALASASPDAPDPAWRAGITCKDRALYIFTSGTTGLPKAAQITHLRMLFMMYGFAGGLNAGPNDRRRHTDVEDTQSSTARGSRLGRTANAGSATTIGNSPPRPWRNASASASPANAPPPMTMPR